MKSRLIFLGMLVIWLFAPSSLRSQAQLPIDPLRMVEWSPDGSLLAFSVGEEAVEIRDINQSVVAHLDLQPGDDVVQPVWSPSGEALAMELANGSLNQRLVIWYFASDTRFELGEDVLDGYVSDDPTWSADSTRLAVARSTALIILDAISGAEIHQATFGNAHQGGGITNIAWSPDGASILVEDETGTISILDGQTYELVNSFLGRELYGSFIDIMWSNDSRHFAGLTTHDIRIYDSETGQVTNTLPSPPGVLTQWSADTMVFISSINTVTLLDSQTWQIITVATLDVGENRIHDVSWNPQHNLFAYTIMSATLEPLPPGTPGLQVLSAG